MTATGGAAVVGRCAWCGRPVRARDALWLTVEQATAVSSAVLWHKTTEACGRRPPRARLVRVPR